jgi:MFS family permease
LAEAPLSSAEDALENPRVGGLQIRVAALCSLVQICDGYDINAIGVSVPSLTHAWNLPGPAFTAALLWSTVGIMAGALSAGPIGDRIGRKPLLLASLTIFGLASLLTAFAGSLLVLSVLRFFTGIGIGDAHRRLRLCARRRGGDSPARAPCDGGAVSRPYAGKIAPPQPSSASQGCGRFRGLRGTESLFWG